MKENQYTSWPGEGAGHGDFPPMQQTGNDTHIRPIDQRSCQEASDSRVHRQVRRVKVSIFDDELGNIVPAALFLQEKGHVVEDLVEHQVSDQHAQRGQEQKSATKNKEKRTTVERGENPPQTPGGCTLHDGWHKGVPEKPNTRETFFETDNNGRT